MWGNILTVHSTPCISTSARRSSAFEYIISDGNYIYREAYQPGRYRVPIENTVRQFMRWMDKTSLVDLYRQNWRSRYA